MSIHFIELFVIFVFYYKCNNIMNYQIKTNSEKMNSGIYIILIDGIKDEFNNVNYLKIISSLKNQVGLKILYQPVINKHLAKTDFASDYGIWVPPNCVIQEFLDTIENIPYKYKIFNLGAKSKKVQHLS